MVAKVAELINLLQLEQIDNNSFLGYSQDIGTGKVFGGQVLGQAVSAAQMTVTDRKIHSAHAYFLRPGDVRLPIAYSVEVTRDGRTYSSRTVTATQQGETIFTMMCSFQKEESSALDYSREIDKSLLSHENTIEVNLEHDPGIGHSDRSKISDGLPFMIRYPDESQNIEQGTIETFERFWVKTNGEIPKTPELHYSILAYTSDFKLLTSNLRPVGYRFQLEKIILATICHSIWFHRDVVIDDWLFTLCEPLSVNNGRGISKGSIYNKQGILVASTMQEGVIRKIKE